MDRQFNSYVYKFPSDLWCDMPSTGSGVIISCFSIPSLVKKSFTEPFSHKEKTEKYIYVNHIKTQHKSEQNILFSPRHSSLLCSALNMEKKPLKIHCTSTQPSVVHRDFTLDPVLHRKGSHLSLGHGVLRSSIKSIIQFHKIVISSPTKRVSEQWPTSDGSGDIRTRPSCRGWTTGLIKTGPT